MVRIPADDFPHDAHGIREYGVMLHATTTQRARVRQFHEAIGLADFATRAHVSVHNFGSPADLGEVMLRLSKIAVDQKPIRINLDPEGAKPWGQDGKAGGFGVELTPELLAFHQAVRSAIDPLTKSFRESGKYWPHVTAYLATDEKEATRAKKLLSEFDLGTGYVARSVEISGRRGPARGGSYTILASFPFGLRVGPADPAL